MRRCSIPFETLADYYDGRADQESVDRIRQHLQANCSHCTDGLAWLQRTAQAIHEGEGVQVPPALVDRLHGLYAERFRVPVRKSFLARLRFDSRANPELAGARTPGGEAFTLNYSSDEYDVEVWEEPTGEGDWYIIGQVLPREGDSIFQLRQVMLTNPGGIEYSVAPELPEFHLPSVPAGVYRMAVQLDEGDILIPEFTVGNAAR